MLAEMFFIYLFWATVVIIIAALALFILLSIAIAIGKSADRKMKQILKGKK